MQGYHRRDFLKISLATLAAALLPRTALAAIRANDDRRTLSFYNTHTGEHIKTCYFENGDYCPDGLACINHILRDHRTGTITEIDPQLLDQLYAIKGLVETDQPFSVISGYRSPRTNRQLRQNGGAVARKSFHTMGQAIDVRLPGLSTQRLRRLALDLKAGGVGYYPRSDFVHLDTGPVRSW